MYIPAHSTSLPDHCLSAWQVRVAMVRLVDSNPSLHEYFAVDRYFNPVNETFPLCGFDRRGQDTLSHTGAGLLHCPTLSRPTKHVLFLITSPSSANSNPSMHWYDAAYSVDSTMILTRVDSEELMAGQVISWHSGASGVHANAGVQVTTDTDVEGAVLAGQVTRTFLDTLKSVLFNTAG